MKKIIVLFMCLLFALSCMYGCGKKEEAVQDTQPAVGTPEEVADTTRMDSAGVDTLLEEVTAGAEETVTE